MNSSIPVLLLGDANVGKRSFARCASGSELIHFQLHSVVRTYAAVVDDISISEHPPGHTTDTEKKQQSETKLFLLINEPQHYDESSEFREKFLSPNRVIGICYNVCDRSTLESAIHKWFPMVRYYNPMAPVFLIGCMSDLKHETPPEMIVSEEQARDASKEIGAVKWLECSSLDRWSIHNVSQWLAWYRHCHFADKKEEVAPEENTECVIL